ncbi:MAG: DUF3892 domain-containing protein [Firmicutes bacterium]|nr:DUF3892 domain-containing protein [Bacillota bacterium]
MKKPVKVIKETSSGRNVKFKDVKTGETMTRPQFVKEIGKGNYPDYHVRNINGLATPVSNPDGKEKNNLG